MVYSFPFGSDFRGLLAFELQTSLAQIGTDGMQRDAANCSDPDNGADGIGGALDAKSRE
jgi:hypothetical protein